MEVNHQHFAFSEYRKCPSTDFNRLMGIGSESYCRYSWSYRIPKNEHPWRAIGNRQSGKKTWKLSQLYLDASIGRDCSIDCFISPNQFFDWRNTKQLALLHANWLEIDINTPAGTPREKKQSLSKQQEQQVITEVFGQLSTQNVPLPTGYVLSGSGGLHLYWMYDAVEAYKWQVSAWREVASALISKLKNGDLWHVDIGASKDPARVLRMPGTKHGSTRRTVDFFSGGAVYSFESLSNALDVKIVKPAYIKLATSSFLPKTQPKALKKNKNAKANKTGTGKHTIGQWWFKIYTHILEHININPVKEGMRDSTAYILFVALRHIKCREAGEGSDSQIEAAYERVRQINKRQIGLTEEQLSDYLQSAKKTHYKYNKDSIATYLEKQLGMDVSFLYEKKDKLSQEQIKNARQAGAQATAKKKSTSTLTRIIQAAKKLLSQNVRPTQQHVAAICGRSERTVRRYWHTAINHPAISSLSIYSPPEECPVASEARLLA